MFEIKTFSMVIFEKLLWFYWVQIRFFTLNIFSPANALVSEETAQDIYFIYTVTNSYVFSDSTHDKPRL